MADSNPLAIVMYQRRRGGTAVQLNFGPTATREQIVAVAETLDQDPKARWKRVEVRGSNAGERDPPLIWTGRRRR